MNGEVVPLDPRRALAEAMDSVPEHDPLRQVLASQQVLWTAIEGAAHRFDAITQPPLLTLAEEKRLIEAVLRELRGALHQQAADAIRNIRLRTLGATLSLGFVLAGAVGAGGYWWGWTQADARIVDTRSSLGAMPAGEASAWAKLMRDNPPIGQLLSRAQPIPSETRGKAVSLAVWIDPPKPATPGAH